MVNPPWLSRKLENDNMQLWRWKGGIILARLNIENGQGHVIMTRPLEKYQERWK